MPSIGTCLIEKNSFVREGIKSLLEQTDYFPSADLSYIEEISKIEKPDNYNLIVMGFDNLEYDAESCVKKLKSCFPKARVVLLSSRLDRQSIISAFSGGADGYILKDISAKAFLGSLNLIMMGEKVFPTSMASLISSGWGAFGVTKAVKPLKEYHLSDREWDILKCLASGVSNKEIAKQLQITESTVKVHLKTILRKLDLANRTQAAIWAVSNGITPQPQQNNQAPQPQASNSSQQIPPGDDPHIKECA